MLGTIVLQYSAINDMCKLVLNVSSEPALFNESVKSVKKNIRQYFSYKDLFTVFSLGCLESEQALGITDSFKSVLFNESIKSGERNVTFFLTIIVQQ